MKKLLKTTLAGTLALLNSSVIAHTGHGDHSVLLAAGDLHTMLSFEHLMFISVALVTWVIAKRI